MTDVEHVSPDVDTLLAPLDALVGEWTADLQHRLMPGEQIRGWATFEWAEGRRFMIQRSGVDERPEFPTALCVMGVPTGELGEALDELMFQTFDSRGVHRLYYGRMRDREWTMSRDVPGWNTRFRATLSEDGSELAGVSQVELDGEWVDDLTFTYRRVEG